MARKKASANQLSLGLDGAAKASPKKPARTKKGKSAKKTAASGTKKPRKQSKPKERKPPKPVGPDYRGRTRKLKVGQCRVREGAVDPATGKPKVFRICREA